MLISIISVATGKSLDLNVKDWQTDRYSSISVGASAAATYSFLNNDGKVFLKLPVDSVCIIEYDKIPEDSLRHEFTSQIQELFKS